jgi:CheY-like chemotaxis protein
VGVDLYLAGNNNEQSNNDNAPSTRNAPAQEKLSDYHNKKDNNGDNYDNKCRPKARLFVVDDDPDIVYVLKHGLVKNGFLVDAFTDPEEAFLRLKTNADDYCFLISDVRMPGLSGIQLARKVKEIYPGIKVVLMTAFEIRDNEFSKVFPSTHVDGFVQKPISVADLTNKILSLIGETKKMPSEGEI